MITVDFFSESPESACHKYRVAHPIAELNADDNFTARFSERWKPEFTKDDVFYFQRNSTQQAASILHQLRADGRSVVYDIDDDIFHIPESNPVFELYLHKPDLPWHQVNCMRFASVVSVSCKGLYELYKQINPNVVILPNCIRAKDWEGVEPILRSTGTLRLFWGGSNTHRDDLMVISQVLPEVKKKYGDAVEIIIMGDSSAGFDCEVTDMPFGTYKFFQGIMCSCDIGLAPMYNNLFNLGKSDLRLKELGAAGLATVASAVGEYNKPESGAILCRTPQEWFAGICALIENEDLRLSAKEQSIRWAHSWDIEKRIDQWKELFEELAIGYKRRSARKSVAVQAPKRSANQVSGGKVRVGVGP